MHVEHVIFTLLHIAGTSTSTLFDHTRHARLEESLDISRLPLATSNRSNTYEQLPRSVTPDDAVSKAFHSNRVAFSTHSAGCLL